MPANYPALLNAQLDALVNDEGLTYEEACKTLGIKLDDSAIVKQADAARDKSLPQLLEDFRPRALKILMVIAEHGESESAQVRAACAILGDLGDVGDESLSNVDKIAERYKKVKKILNIIDAETSVTAGENTTAKLLEPVKTSGE